MPVIFILLCNIRHWKKNYFCCTQCYIFSELFLVTWTPMFIYWNITFKQIICKCNCVASSQYVRTNLLDLLVLVNPPEIPAYYLPSRACGKSRAHACGLLHKEDWTMLWCRCWRGLAFRHLPLNRVVWPKLIYFEEVTKNALWWCA